LVLARRPAAIRRGSIDQPQWAPTTTAARIIYAGPRLSQTILTHSVSGASDTITITSGYTVQSQDVDATVEITGGTNATAGWYRIASVDTGANSWTLDRACTIGSSSNLTGTMTYTLIRDTGFGTVYSGLGFKGHATYTGTPRCHIGVHVKSVPEITELINSDKVLRVVRKMLGCGRADAPLLA
jgi:hypothetical protein